MERTVEAVDEFMARFAGDLEAAGVPRLPARVFVALLAEDDGSLTSADLVDRLHISPAAVSGAVRYLTQVQLIRREREPGSRRDRYRVSDDAWYEVMASREALLRRWIRTLAGAEQALGPATPAGARMRETREFMEFLDGEMPRLLAKWRRQRARR